MSKAPRIPWPAPHRRRTTARAGAWLDPANHRPGPEHLPATPPIRSGHRVELRTPREKDVLALIGTGQSDTGSSLFFDHRDPGMTAALSGRRFS